MSFAKERTGEWTEHIKETCRLCKTGKESIVRTNKFCYVCKDTFCESHVEDHSCLGEPKAVYISEVDKARTITQKLLCCRRVVCKCNNISPVSVYCYAEKDVICKGCHMQSHMAHKTVSVVRKCASYKKANLSVLIAKVKQLNEENNLTLKDRQSQIMSFITLKHNAQRYIHSLSTGLIKHVDLKDQAILKHLEAHASEYKQAMKLHVEMCTNLEKSLQNDLDCLIDIRTGNFKPDMFATDLIISRRLAFNERNLKYIQSPSLAFRRGEHLIRLLTRIQKLGDSLKEADREPLKAVDANGKESVFSASKQAKNPTGTEINPSLSREVHPCCKRQHMRHTFVFPVRGSSSDEKPIFATGCTIMNNGNVALILIDRPDWDSDDCDKAHVVLLDKSLDFLCQLELPSEPHDISTVNESSVIITLPDAKQLQHIIVIFEQLKPGRILQMEKSYYGVEVIGKTIYATYIEYVDDGDKCNRHADKAEVQILSLDGKILKRFAYKENADGFLSIKEPLYLTVDASTERIFVSDSDMGALTCLKFDGTIIFQYHTDKYSFHAVCVCNENNIAVLGNCDIQIVSSTGELLSTINLIDEDNTYVLAESIAYKKQTDTFVFGYHIANRYCFSMTQNVFYHWWSYLG